MKFAAAALALASAVAATSTLPASAATPAARSFVHSPAAGVPATSVVSATGRQVPVIRWTSSAFDGSGWSQERRCKEVSACFDQFLKQGRLAFNTTGRMNGLPVICTAASRGGACDGLLYTLKPGQDATSTLRNLLQLRYSARGPLNETTPRLYVSLDELLRADHVDAASDQQPQSPGGLF